MKKYGLKFLLFSIVMIFIPIMVTDGAEKEENISLSDLDVLSQISYLPGDADGNGRINTLDITAIRRYISDGRITDPNGYNVVINENAADVDGNGRINTLDITMIRRYISDGRTTDPNGYNIVLKPGKMTCEHNLTGTDAKDSTCSESGNIAYWYCNKCSKYFSDAEAKYEILYENTLIELNTSNHTYETTWSYDEDAHWYNSTCEHLEEVKDYDKHTYEGNKCSICGVAETFTVQFVDFDNSIIDIQLVEYGCDAKRPDDPVRKNYVFIGWDSECTNINSDLIVKAQYVRQYKVTFVDYDGVVLKEEYVQENAPATAPFSNTEERNEFVELDIEGYDFVCWDKEFTNVLSDLTITATYKIKSYIVKFVTPDGIAIARNYCGICEKYYSNAELIDINCPQCNGEISKMTEQIVEHGFSAIAPEYPEIFLSGTGIDTKIYSFTRWDKTFDNVTGDLEIKAIYETAYTMPVIIVDFGAAPHTNTNIYIYSHSSITLNGVELEIGYKTNEGEIVMNSVSFTGVFKDDSQYVINYYEKLFTYVWSKAEGFSHDNCAKLATFDLEVIIGGTTISEDTFIVKMCDIIISDSNGDNIEKITPVVVYR